MTNVHHGYGRTRRPKNIAGPDGTAATPGVEYKTENQRFLIVVNGNANEITAVNIHLNAGGAAIPLANSAVAAGTAAVIEISGADLVSVTGAGGEGDVILACSTF